MIIIKVNYIFFLKETRNNLNNKINGEWKKKNYTLILGNKAAIKVIVSKKPFLKKIS